MTGGWAAGAPAAVAREARRRLKSLARPAGSFDARRCFRGDQTLIFYAVAAPAVRALAVSIVRAEDLIQKAVGWLLGEAGKANPGRLEAYLRANGPRLARTTVRYAIERFRPVARRDRLESTRPASSSTRNRRAIRV